MHLQTKNNFYRPGFSEISGSIYFKEFLKSNFWHFIVNLEYLLVELFKSLYVL